jgi:hypothetical protein
MEDSTAFMREDHQHEEQPTRRGRHDEEIGRGDLLEVIREEGAPRL